RARRGRGRDRRRRRATVRRRQGQGFPGTERRRRDLARGVLRGVRVPRDAARARRARARVEEARGQRRAEGRAHRGPGDGMSNELDELRALQQAVAEADRMIEACVRDRVSLRVLCERLLPATERWFGAKGALLTTRNEHLVEETFTWGLWSLLGGIDL